jgi:hypothetical protein
MESKKEEERVVYKVKCKNCEKLYIGETKFRMMKGIQQHQKDVEFRRTSSAIARHVEDFKHEIDWDSVGCLEKEKRLSPRKILESGHIRANKEKMYEFKLWTWSD